MGLRRRTGQDSTATSGLMTNGASSEMPRKIAMTPPMPAAATSAVGCAEAPRTQAPARPTAMRLVPITARRQPGRRRSPSLPSTAWIGGILPARRAG